MSRWGQRLVRLLWRWHRRTGVLIFVFVFFMAATGVVLNHSSEFGLDRNFVEWPWLSGAYGDRSAEVAAYRLGDDWIARTLAGKVYLNTREVASCRGRLVGALSAAELLVVACAQELLLLMRDGELVEALGTSTGLPVPLTGIGKVRDQVVLRRGQTWLLADLETLVFEGEPAAGTVIAQLAPGTLPQDIRAAIPASAQWLTWERLLLDLHSGRVFGYVGVLFVDGIALLLGCVVLSGFTLWFFHRGRRRLLPRQ